MKRELAELYAVYGPCGREKKIAKELSKLIAPFADELSVDLMGNLIAVKKGVSGKNVMLSCPMDRPGLVTVDYNDSYLRSDFIGDLSFEAVYGLTAMLEDGTEMPVYNTDAAGKKLFETSVGISLDQVSDCGQYGRTAQFSMLKSVYCEDNEGVTAFGAGSVACCKTLINVLKKCKTDHTVTVVFTAMSEINDKGLGSALYEVKPDAWIELRLKEAEPGRVELGKGPVAEISMMRRRGECRILTEYTENTGVQYLMMNGQAKNPVFGYKRERYGYAEYYPLGLPVTGLKTKDERCLWSDIEATADFIASLLERV